MFAIHSGQTSTVGNTGGSKPVGKTGAGLNPVVNNVDLKGTEVRSDANFPADVKNLKMEVDGASV